MKKLEILNVEKGYGKETVLSGLSLSVEAGERVFITGPSGCGKTTLLRLIAGLETPDSGEIRGVPEKLSFVFQEDRLCEEFDAVRNIRLVTGKKRTRKEILEGLRRVGLEEDLTKPVSSFSGGMKRRTAIVRALLAGGDLILMDEPLKGLDEELRQQVIRYIRLMTEGRTLIAVTHDLRDIAAFQGREIRLEKTGTEKQ